MEGEGAGGGSRGSGGGQGNHIDLIKMDADGPEGKWLEHIERRLSEKTLQVSSLIIECNGCEAHVLYRMQRNHRYDAYLLPTDVNYHFLNGRGFDVTHRFDEVSARVRMGCVCEWDWVTVQECSGGVATDFSHRLTNSPSAQRPTRVLSSDQAGDPDFLIPMYAVRLMRHVYRFKPMSERQWRRAQGVLGSAIQYLFTRLPMVETRRPKPEHLMDPELEELAPGRPLHGSLFL